MIIVVLFCVALTNFTYNAHPSNYSVSLLRGNYKYIQKFHESIIMFKKKLFNQEMFQILEAKRKMCQL